MAGREYIPPHKAFCHGNLSFFSEFKKLFFCSADFYAAARINNRPLRFIDNFGSFFDFIFGRLRHANDSGEISIFFNKIL